MWFDSWHRYESFLQMVHAGPGVHPVFCSTCIRDLPLGWNVRAWRWLLIPCNAQVDNGWNCTFTPPCAFRVCLLTIIIPKKFKPGLDSIQTPIKWGPGAVLPDKAAEAWSLPLTSNPMPKLRMGGFVTPCNFITRTGTQVCSVCAVSVDWDSPRFFFLNFDWCVPKHAAQS
jgi:hypothetical protein